MIDIAEARRLAEKRLRSRLGQWAGECAVDGPATDNLAAGDPGADCAAETRPAFELGLKPPTEKEVLSDSAAAEDWVRTWRAAEEQGSVSLEWQSRAWKSVGRQDVPTRIRIDRPDDLAAFAGGGVGHDWRRLSGRSRTIRSRWPSAGDEEFATGLRGVAKRLLDLDDDTFHQVIDVVSWLAANPLGRMRPRQLPIRGVDSKWFGTHRGLVTALLPLAAESPDSHAGTGLDPRAGTGLDILDTESTLRLRILDPEMALGSLRDIAAPVEQLAALNVRPSTVLVFENLESVLSLPDRADIVAIHGSGYAVEALTRLPWVTSARVVYWGDLDSHGFAILNRLRTHLPGVESVLMDEGTLLAHRDLWVPEPKPHPGRFAALTGIETRALERIRAEGNARLEQERIPWETALAAVDAVLSCRTPPQPRVRTRLPRRGEEAEGRTSR